MNKFGMVLGLAAVATLAGCKDPNWKHENSSQNEVKKIDTVATTPVEKTTPTQIDTTTVVVEPIQKKCTCLPGTKHTEPCGCGAPDCQCIVETKKPVIAVDLTPPPKADESEQEYTIYTVQSGDYLAKISKKYNVTIAAIRRLNPSIKNDMIRIGQKIKLPGKIDVPVAPVTAPVKSAAVKASAATTYTGATKEYVVKGGDTLGSIAYGNGINVRQLKSLNGLTSDTIKVGQKMKIPAEKVVKVAAVQTPKVDKKIDKPVEQKVEAVVAPVVDDVKADAPVVEPNAAEATIEPTPAAPVEKTAATTSYVVKEGDDITGVSIQWGVTAAEIRELNNLSENDQLMPGQVIKLPADAQQ